MQHLHRSYAGQGCDQRKRRVDEAIVFVADQRVHHQDRRRHSQQQWQPTPAKQRQGDDEGECTAPEISKKPEDVKPRNDGVPVADALVEINPDIEPDTLKWILPGQGVEKPASENGN